MKLLCADTCVEHPVGIRNRGKFWPIVASVLVVLMPKCAMCWAAYMSVFTSLGLTAVRYQPWFLPVSIALFVCTLIKLLITAVRRRNYTAFALALIGSSVILYQKYYPVPETMRMVAMLMLVAAVMMDNLRTLWRSIGFRRHRPHQFPDAVVL